jgi:hypothetical protein
MFLLKTTSGPRIIKELSGKGTSVVDSTHCIDRANLCSGNNDIDRIIEEVPSSLEGQIGIRPDPILCIFSSIKIHFQLSLFYSRIHKRDD